MTEENEYFSDEDTNDILIDSYHNIPLKYTFLNKISDNEILIECNATDLINNIYIWDKQRILEETHVKDIIDYQIKNYNSNNKFSFTGIFYICGIKNKDYRIIDGQHRLAAIHTLSKLYKNYDFHIMVWVIDCKDEEERLQYFQNINLARPISFTDFLLDTESEIINKTAQHFYLSYKNFFSDTQILHPKRPNIKLDTFKNELLHYRIVEKLNITNSQELIDYIENYNTYLGTLHPDDFPKKSSSNNAKLFNLAIKKGKLYLGMYPNFEWIDKLIENTKFKNNNKVNIENKSVEFSTNKLNINSNDTEINELSSKILNKLNPNKQQENKPENKQEIKKSKPEIIEENKQENKKSKTEIVEEKKKVFVFKE